MPTPYQFGDQPVRKVMRDQRWTTQLMSRKLGVTYSQLRWVIAGRTVPSGAIRNGLSRILDTPVEQLFTEDALSREYIARGPRPKAKVSA